ncbi:MAG TPA: Gfo/Idh/MocA family oxidoreductase [bacterium]|nr:Gfo/Idh/MocA family oxidoreductase [bacterium]
MKPIKAAVIGTGFIGPAHIEALKRIAGVEIAAVVSSRPDRAKQLAAMHAIPKAYSDWKQLAADSQIEVVHNCTPNNLHFEINRAMILAGKHLVSEKPLTLNSRESAELVKLAREKKVINAINFNYRFYPLIQQARAMVQKNEIGDVYLIHGHYLQDWLYFDTDYNWRLDSDISGESCVIADIGSHWCDLMQFISGLKIKQVFADLTTIHKTRQRPKQPVDTFKGKETSTPTEFEPLSINTEDIGSMLLQFENGAHGVFTVSQLSAGRKNRLWFEIDGSKKALAWDQEQPNQLWVGYRQKPNEIIIKDPSLLDESARQFAHYPGGHPEGYADVLKNMFIKVYDYIREGKNTLSDKPEFPTFTDGHLEMQIVEAALKSFREQRWIEI